MFYVVTKPVYNSFPHRTNKLLLTISDSCKRAIDLFLVLDGIHSKIQFTDKYIYIYIDYENAPSTKDVTIRINPYLFLHGLHSLFSTLKSDLIQ